LLKSLVVADTPDSMPVLIVAVVIERGAGEVGYLAVQTVLALGRSGLASSIV
jgi:hypothetical protein